LLALSSILISFAWLKGYKVDITKLFSINQYLVTLLIGVGFLRLIATPKNEEIDTKKGEKSFLKDLCEFAPFRLCYQLIGSLTYR